jgi:putative RNA 2'-phosphotransferase
MSVDVITASKFLSLLLRHKPEEIGLVLDAEGWAEIDEIVRLTSGGRIPLSENLIKEIVRTSDKQRFAISEKGSKIRANQGHSIAIDLALVPKQPPETLYHGTATRFVQSILREGLLRGERRHVHLSSDDETAVKVGKRHGEPVVLIVAAGEMAMSGYTFYLSDNGVWLTEHVPARFIQYAA